ncbi:hypothetical protein [Streptococcus merionis]|uniref:hypothetical protein n=1 Tax=Streptococcus merionis TaxID=400065 RepID=UPI003519396C
MEFSTDMIVMREKEKGYYLEKLESKDHSIATKTCFVDELRGALSLPWEDYLRQKVKVKALAKVYDLEIVRVQSTHVLTYPNDSEVTKIEREDKSPGLFDILEQLM